MCPNYSKHGKQLTVIKDPQFAEGMNKGPFKKPEYRAIPVLYFYSAVRKTEGNRAIKDQFNVTPDTVFFDVGPRLKKIRHWRKDGRKRVKLTDEQYERLLKKRTPQISTPPLPLPRNAPFMDELVRRIEETESGERVLPWSAKTIWNVIDAVFTYPHHFRLSRITWFFLPHPEVDRPRGFSIPEVRSFTGLSLGALDYYIGLADMSDMGRAMYQEQRQNGG